MQSFVVTTAGAVSVALAVYLVPAQPVRAQVWPWCAEMSGETVTNCGFASWQQCQTYISGIGGFCSPNPQSGPASRRERLWR
jgi:hypothetical protein